MTNPQHHDPHSPVPASDTAGPTEGIDPAALAQGHEPDVGRDVRQIIGVPVVIVVTMVTCFAIVWGLFNYFTRADRRPPAQNPLAAPRDHEPLNVRLGNVKTRLEGLRQREPEAEMYRSSTEAKDGNSAEFHPEDIRYDRVPALSDPKDAYKRVQGQDGAVTIPIDAAIAAARAKNLVPVAPNAVDPADVPSSLRTREANSGVGQSPQGGK